ncbi:hypothetical protein FAVG1_13167 [Fusarium avenaceum]|nr:hypothetical protein FAVG1_13167 [Fusarium avenaceum]
MAAAPDSTIVLVSGANQGIGLAVAKELAEYKYHVIIGSRKSTNGERVASEISSEGHSASSVQLDIESDESIAAAVEHISKTYGRLDVLINNAGIHLDGDYKGRLSKRELFSKTFSTNVIGTACLTDSCLPLLSKSQLPRLIFVSSHLGSLQLASDKTEPSYCADWPAYCSSKTALNMLALSYSRLLVDTPFLVNAVAPGLVQTNATTYNRSHGSPPEEGARRIVQLATMEKGSATATFTDQSGNIPW